MAKATLNGAILAETNHYEVVEGNVYFPPESINHSFFQTSDLHTTCPWKGIASYMILSLLGKRLKTEPGITLTRKRQRTILKTMLLFMAW